MTPVAGKMLGGAGAAANFVAGNVAGGISAALLNPIQAVRYRAFSLNAKSGASSRSFLAAAQHMSARGGIRPFFKGIYPTVYRDLIFGGLYSLIRHELFHRLSPALPAGVHTHTHTHTSSSIASPPRYLQVYAHTHTHTHELYHRLSPALPAGVRTHTHTLTSSSIACPPLYLQVYAHTHTHTRTHTHTQHNMRKYMYTYIFIFSADSRHFFCVQVVRWQLMRSADCRHFVFCS